MTEFLDFGFSSSEEIALVLAQRLKSLRVQKEIAQADMAQFENIKPQLAILFPKVHFDQRNNAVTLFDVIRHLGAGVRPNGERVAAIKRMQKHQPNGDE